MHINCMCKIIRYTPIRHWSLNQQIKYISMYIFNYYTYYINVIHIFPENSSPVWEMKWDFLNFLTQLRSNLLLMQIPIPSCSLYLTFYVIKLGNPCLTLRMMKCTVYCYLLVSWNLPQKSNWEQTISNDTFMQLWPKFIQPSSVCLNSIWIKAKLVNLPIHIQMVVCKIKWRKS